MSRISQVVKNKNRVEKMRKARNKEEMVRLKNQTAYKARLYDELSHVDVILEDNDIDGVKITIPNQMIAQFSNSLYSDDLIGYDVEQVPDEPNSFIIRKKLINF